MLCEVCSKNQASVRVTEISQGLTPQGQKTQSVSLKHLCASCAQQMELAIMPAAQSKNFASIMSMLKSAGRERAQTEPPCPQCGMTLAEFRAKGRLGCAHDYEHFGKQLEPLLQRMHNATRHFGRIPGLDALEQERRARLGDLRQRLEVAIREEAYEAAARLRDELVQLDPPAAVASPAGAAELARNEPASSPARPSDEPAGDATRPGSASGNAADEPDTSRGD